eukprot:1142766-Pelagomonas_calceolata.AAC.8
MKCVESLQNRIARRVVGWLTQAKNCLQKSPKDCYSSSHCLPRPPDTAGLPSSFEFELFQKKLHDMVPSKEAALEKIVLLDWISSKFEVAITDLPPWPITRARKVIEHAKAQIPGAELMDDAFGLGELTYTTRLMDRPKKDALLELVRDIFAVSVL